MKKIVSVLLSVVLVVTLSFSVSMMVSAGDADPTIVVSSGTTNKGGTKDITISLKNNPGIVSLKLKVWIPNGLSLVSFDQNTSFDGTYDGIIDPQEPEQVNNANEWVRYDIKKGVGIQPQGISYDENTGKPFVFINWANLSGSVENVTGDVDFATLRLKVADDAELGDIDIVVTYDPEDVHNRDDVNVAFEIENGKITVTDVIKGDVDGDTEVTSDDAIYLLYYTLMPDDFPINQDADFDGDGEVTSDDAIYLLYYTLMPDDFPLN